MRRLTAGADRTFRRERAGPRQRPRIPSEQQWFFDWAQSPGFGGLAAVAAAVIAFFAAWHQAKVQRLAQRKEQWWKRAEWALDLTLSDDRDLRKVGLGTLQSLADSHWAGEHEADVVATAADRVLYAPTEPACHR